MKGERRYRLSTRCWRDFLPFTSVLLGPENLDSVHVFMITCAVALINSGLVLPIRIVTPALCPLQVKVPVVPARPGRQRKCQPESSSLQCLKGC